MTPIDGNRIRKGDLFGVAERRARILVVDDDPASRTLLLTVMRHAGLMNCTAVGTARETIEQFDRIRPDLVVVDLHLPDQHGIALVTELKSRISPEEYLPFLIVTGDDRHTAR